MTLIVAITLILLCLNVFATLLIRRDEFSAENSVSGLTFGHDPRTFEKSQYTSKSRSTANSLHAEKARIDIYQRMSSRVRMSDLTPTFDTDFDPACQVLAITCKYLAHDQARRASRMPVTSPMAERAF